MVYHDWAAGGIECSIVATDPRWKDKGTLLHLFGYPFMHLGCNRITVRVLATNTASLKLMKKLGFVEEGKLRKAVDGVDQFIFGMLRDECPHIPQKGEIKGKAIA